MIVYTVDYRLADGQQLNPRYPRGGGVLLGIIAGGVPPGSLNPDPISDRKNVIIHTRFQIWPFGKNYVIIT